MNCVVYVHISVTFNLLSTYRSWRFRKSYPDIIT